MAKGKKKKEKDIVDDALDEKPLKDDSRQEAEPAGEPDKKEVRRMVEDIAVTPFFKRHSKHMPATIKLHAELRVEDDYIIFETSMPGFDEDEVKIEASVNSIDISLLMDKRKDGKEEDVYFHNSFITPEPIDYKKVKIEHKGDVLSIKAPLKKE